MIQKNRLYFSISFISCVLLYFITTTFPVFKASQVIGAFAITLFAFLFITRTTDVLLKRKTGDILLVSLAVFAILGVFVINKSLYNFSELPVSKKIIKVVENDDKLQLMEFEKSDSKSGKIIFESVKKFWLFKMFSINICLLVIALSLGCLLGKKVEKPSHIFAIIVLGGVMDMWSVTSGVTQKIVSSKLNCYYFLFNWPVAGSASVTYPLIGSTDFLFIALFLYLVRKFELPVFKNIVGLVLGVLSSIFCASVLGVGIPALPFIGLAVLILNFKAILPDRNEMIQIVVGSIVIFTTFSLLWKLKKK